MLRKPSLSICVRPPVKPSNLFCQPTKALDEAFLTG
jgi:hypothetical protein